MTRNSFVKEKSKTTRNVQNIHYVNEIISEYGLEDAKISKIPLDWFFFKQKISKADWIVVEHISPDICASVAVLAKKVYKPTDYDWNELKRIVTYMKRTRRIQFQMGSNKEEDQTNRLIGYADANWAEDRDDSKSNGGYIFKLNGATISWGSEKQDFVAFCFTTAELISLK